MKITAAVLAVMLVVIIYFGSDYALDDGDGVIRVSETRVIMDTYVQITVYAEEGKGDKAIDDAFTRIGEIDGIASRFDDQAELYRLNRDGYLDDPSDELVEMLELSIEAYDTTGGTFDITIMPLLDLWDPSSGAGPFYLFNVSNSYSSELDAGNMPSALVADFEDEGYTLNATPTVYVITAGTEWIVASDWVAYTLTDSTGQLDVGTDYFWNVMYDVQESHIQKAQTLMGKDKISITADRIELANGTRLTLDGMAKGYAVDMAIDDLKEAGIRYGLVNAGGDLMTIGSKPNDEDWKIALENPDDPTEYIGRFHLEGMAVASSGNYRRYYDDNASVGHIMDPRTGRSVNISIGSSVVARTATEADIMATAVFVLGPVEGITLIDSVEGVEGLIIGSDRSISSSAKLEKYGKVND